MDKHEKFWDTAAKRFKNTEKKFEKIHLEIISKAKKYLKKNDIVLDYGCGAGTKALELAGLIQRIEGIDVSSKMIEIAKKNAVERKIKNIEFAQKNIFNRIYKNESLDVVLAFNILHLLGDIDKVIKRVRELLKPGGLFITATPCLAEKKSFLINMQFSPYRILSGLKLIPYIKLFKSREIDDLISNNNFQIIETEKMYQKLTNYFIVAGKI